jgi:hypothetical protein
MRFLWLVHAITYPREAGSPLHSFKLLRELTHRHAVDLTAFAEETWVATAFFPSLEEDLQESKRVLVRYRDLAETAPATSSHS